MSAVDGLAPMLLIERPLNLSEPGWVYELKFDGYRLLAEFGDGSAKLRTRNGADAAISTACTIGRGAVDGSRVRIRGPIAPSICSC